MHRCRRGRPPCLTDPTPPPASASGCSAARSTRRMPGTCTSPSWALKAFGLDRVWWLVSPGNPLKPDAPADLARRLAAARAIMRHPRVEVTDLEARLGTRYTAATLAALQARYPGVRFVWLMGADNLAGFHRWERWPEIMAAVPVGVLARPGEQLRAGLSPAARRFARWRLPQAQARGAAVPRAAGLDAGQRADARPLVERAARARGVAAVSGAVIGRRAVLAGGGGLAGGAGGACGGGGRGASRSRRSSAASGLGGADRLRGGRPRRRRAARGAPGGRGAAAGVGREDRHRALCARRARAGLPVPHRDPRRRAGRGRGARRATWCWRAAATRCSTPTRSADWSRALRRARARRRSRGGSWSPTGALPAVAEIDARPAGGRGLQPDDLGDEPELQPGVPRLGAGRGGPGAGASARRGERFEVPVSGDPRPSWSAAGCRGTASRAGAEIWTLPRGRPARAGQRLAAGAGARRPMPARSSRGLAAGPGWRCRRRRWWRRRRARCWRCARARRSSRCCATCCAIRPT